MVQITKIIGVPGAGKTTKLLGIIEKLAKKFNLNEIAYSSFTNAAVNEMKERVHSKLDVKENELMYFRTIHSLAYRLLGTKFKIISKNEIMKFTDSFVDRFCKKIIEEMDLDIIYGMLIVDDFAEQVISVDAFVKNPVKWMYDMNRYIILNFPDLLRSPRLEPKVISILKDQRFGSKYRLPLYTTLKQYRNSLRSYMIKLKKLDFDHILLETYMKKVYLPIKILIVDEYQDVNALQDLLVNIWASKASKLYIAGDSNQSIYSYQGGSPSILENIKEDKLIFLNKTWRLPSSVIEIAKSMIENKWVQQMFPGTARKGKVDKVDFNEIKFMELINSNKSIFILCRTNKYCDFVRSVLVKQGIIPPKVSDNTKRIIQILRHIQIQSSISPSEMRFILNTQKKGGRRYIFRPDITRFLGKWIEDIEENKPNVKKTINVSMLHKLIGTDDLVVKFSNLVIPKERKDFEILMKINVPDRIKIMTMHASKGKEAEVIILVNAASYFEIKNKVVDKEEERRVYYVAATRAKKRLIFTNMPLINPKMQFEPSQFIPEALTPTQRF